MTMAAAGKPTVAGFAVFGAASAEDVPAPPQGPLQAVGTAGVGAPWQWWVLSGVE
uniref:hypothetical protein n=1 Tax=Mycolicibacterium sp. CBMA 213 TaxID=1968788 RepID=UPI00155D9300|nr:hypothetical protein [Mycolicibacterium sp. CBMA 213]